MSYRRDGMEMCSPFDENGLLEDWDVVEAIWEHTLKKRLVVEPNEHPILMGEPAHTTREKREKMVELLFEKHNPPAIFPREEPVPRGVRDRTRDPRSVVDCGGGGTTVSAVHDGYVLYTGSHTTPMARWTPILKDFARRISPPTPRFQSPPSTPFNSQLTPFNSTPQVRVDERRHAIAAGRRCHHGHRARVPREEQEDAGAAEVRV